MKNSFKIKTKLSPFNFLIFSLLTTLTLLSLISPSYSSSNPYSTPYHDSQPSNNIKHPLIIDTDIGADIDDTFALIYSLEKIHLQKKFDLKLITTSTFDTQKRAKILAKVLQETGNGSINIGIGEPTPFDETIEYKAAGYQYPWAEDYQLKDYPGVVYDDGVKAMGDLIMEFNEENKKTLGGSSNSNESNGVVNGKRCFYLLLLGPLSNIGELKKRFPLVFDTEFMSIELRLFIMGGSFEKGFYGSGKIHEYNIYTDIPAAQALFNTKNPPFISLTPLDTSALIQIKDNNYFLLLKNQEKNPKIKLLMECYEVWYNTGGKKYQYLSKHRFSPNQASSNMYDVQAAQSMFFFEENGSDFSHPFLDYERLNIRVDDKGFINICGSGSGSGSDDDCGEVDVGLRFKEDNESVFAELIEKEIVYGILGENLLG